MNLFKLLILGLACGVWAYLIVVPFILPMLQDMFGEQAGLVLSYPLDLIGIYAIFEHLGKRVK